MIGRIEIKSRGAVGRNMRRVMNNAQKAAWHETGKSYATNNVPKRFTPEFARIANYSPRSGQTLARGSKGFWSSYFGRKLRKFGHADPFVFSGQTRRNARIASVSSTSKGTSVRLPGTGRINFHPKYAAEFRSIIPSVQTEIVKTLDDNLDRELKNATNS